MIPLRSLLPLALLTACASTGPAPKPATPAVSTGTEVAPTQLTSEQKARDAARAPLAAALIDAYVNGAAQFSPDGKKVLFQSNRRGSPQLYIGDIGDPSGQPVSISRGPERVDFADFTRDGKWILFLRDQGADENYRIYRVGLDGTGETNLTPGVARHRDPFLEPRNKPGTIAYTQHDPKSPASEVVVLPLDGAPRVVYTDPAPSNLTDVSPDGSRALMLRLNSLSDAVLFEIELGTGNARRIFPPEGKKIMMNDARYSADGARAFAAGDDGADGEYVYAIELSTASVKAQYRQDSPPTAFVSTIQASPRGDQIAITVNAGNHSEVRILDASTLAPRTTVQAPLGWLETTRYSDDGTRFGLTVSAPQAPADIFAVDAASGAVSPLRHDARQGLESMPPLTTSIEIVKAFDGLTIPINTYLPPTAGKRLPVIVAFHGGPAWSYQVRWNVTARFFTQLGYAYVEPNVRGSTGFGRAYEMADDREKRADWLKDVETCNAWAKAQPWADPARVIVWGGSYGGYTVLMALTRQPTLWHAGVDMVGVANLITFVQSTDQAIRAVFVQEFGDLDRDRELLERFSPIRDVDRIASPLFVYAGANDPRVPRAESDQIVRALRSRRIPVEYMVSVDEGHSLDRRENRIEFYTRVARFLEDQVK